jgi:hypothetical protein
VEGGEVVETDAAEAMGVCWECGYPPPEAVVGRELEFIAVVTILNTFAKEAGSIH